MLSWGIRWYLCPESLGITSWLHSWAPIWGPLNWASLTPLEMPWFPHHAFPSKRTFAFLSGSGCLYAWMNGKSGISGTYQASQRHLATNIWRRRDYTTYSSMGNSAIEQSCPAQRPGSLSLNAAAASQATGSVQHRGGSLFPRLQFSGPRPRKRKKRMPKPEASSFPCARLTI